MVLDGQVQHGIGGVEVGEPSAPVGEAIEGDLAEHRREATFMAGLHPAPPHAVDIDHRVEADLVVGAQVQVVLQYLAQQLAPVDVDAPLQFAMVRPGRLGAPQPGQHSLQARSRPAEAVIVGRRHRCTPDRGPARRARSEAMPALAAASSSALAPS